MLAKLNSATTIGLDAHLVEVEVDIQRGMHKFNIVGLPDKAVQESKERVFSAIKNSYAEFIYQRLTVNLAPGNIPKTGSAYDLPIALGMLIASGQLEMETRDSVFVGELSLEGNTRPIEGILVIADWARRSGFKRIFVPIDNAREASLIEKIEVFPVKNINEIIETSGKIEKFEPENLKNSVSKSTNFVCEFDFRDIRGQEQAKRALQIAATGLHNIIFSGSPGSGKTMLAKAIPSILPDITFDESLELTRIYSIAGMLPSDRPLFDRRPFRNPHHTSSDVALVGGGRIPKPGEITLAHNGVLFLDEFPEFSRRALESLRQPMEDGVISISRANGSLKFPARFMLVAAMNPCKCGWRGDATHECTCSEMEYIKYQKRISGPILDRIDLQIFVSRVENKKLIGENLNVESSDEIRQKIDKAHQNQFSRYKDERFRFNSALPQKLIDKHINLGNDARRYIAKIINILDISARGYFRILKVARSIADLEGVETIREEDIAEALSYRMLN